MKEVLIVHIEDMELEDRDEIAQAIEDAVAKFGVYVSAPIEHRTDWAEDAANDPVVLGQIFSRGSGE